MTTMREEFEKQWVASLEIHDLERIPIPLQGVLHDVAWNSFYAAWHAATLAERERCAKVCEEYASHLKPQGTTERTALKCAAAIRGVGDEEGAT